jgi:hypothetical protein
MKMNQEKIPVFKKWSYWYILVIVVLIAKIIFFSLFTKFFS